MVLRVFAAGACLLLAGLGSAAAEDIAHGKRVFRACASCHSAERPTNMFGPSLLGVVGRKAGVVADYQYSDAMKAAAASGLTWDRAALSEFLANPKAKVPGTSMRFWGLWTDSEISDVIAYLASQQ